jgi:phosphatidylinositol alpha-1,6-mannosyltransferase
MMQAEQYKGHDELIQAWPAITQEVPDAQLIVVGQGDDLPRLKELAQGLGVREAVLFVGHVDDDTLRAIYQRVSAFAMPSRGEGFGIVYLEAMLHQLACIGSIHDAAGEIIVDGETGFLVNQDNSSELAMKVVQLLTDSTLRQRLGRNGYERLRSNFSSDRFEMRVSQVLTNWARNTCP